MKILNILTKFGVSCRARAGVHEGPENCVVSEINNTVSIEVTVGLIVRITYRQSKPRPLICYVKK